MIKTSAILSCLFVAVLIILAGREMWRDKKREMKQSAVFADNVPDEINRKNIHPEETDKEKRMTEANIRKFAQEYKHWEKDYNNYRKMHGEPLVRKGGANYEDHINRKFKRGSR